MNFRSVGLAIALTFIGHQQAAAIVVIDTVVVGDAGNANDTTGLGSVGYAYRMGAYEVTNSQYAEFLNAKAASDPLGLYHSSMTNDFEGGIVRSGSDGTYSYAPKTSRGDNPVNWVSWYDSIRFANWMHNGQGGGDTETGAYTLLGGTPTPSNGDSVTRNPDADWALPTRDEWYKAAYYDPSTDMYFEYPTSSDTAPDAPAPPGGSNSANYFGDPSFLGAPTDVGAYTFSPSPSGTFDQGGNMSEWFENLDTVLAGHRENRGGNWASGSLVLSASSPLFEYLPDDGGISDAHGFRLINLTAIPEVNALWLLGTASVVSLGLRTWTRTRREST